MGIVVLTVVSTALLDPIFMPYLLDNSGYWGACLALAFLPAAIAGLVFLAGLHQRPRRTAPADRGRAGGGRSGRRRGPIRAVALAAGLSLASAAAAFAAAIPAEEALVIDVADSAHQGSALGYYTAAAALGGVIGPLLGGWLYSWLWRWRGFRHHCFAAGARRDPDPPARARAFTCEGGPATRAVEPLAAAIPHLRSSRHHRASPQSGHGVVDQS